MNSQNLIGATIVLIFASILGAFPLAMIAALFGGGSAFVNLLLLGGIILGSWFPMKIAFDQQIKGETNLNIFPKRLSPQAMPVIRILSVLLIPLLWAMNFSTALVGVIAYVITGNLPVALAFAIVYQGVTLYQATQREKARGANSQFFVFMDNMPSNFQVDTIQIEAPPSKADTTNTSYGVDESISEEPQMSYQLREEDIIEAEYEEIDPDEDDDVSYSSKN